MVELQVLLPQCYYIHLNILDVHIPFGYTVTEISTLQYISNISSLKTYIDEICCVFCIYGNTG
jgi:hypothetical protein